MLSDPFLDAQGHHVAPQTTISEFQGEDKLLKLLSIELASAIQNILAQIVLSPFFEVTSIKFINSISCLHLQTYRSLAAIVSKNPQFSLFPIEKPRLQNLTLP